MLDKSTDGDADVHAFEIVATLRLWGSVGFQRQSDDQSQRIISRQPHS